MAVANGYKPAYSKVGPFLKSVGRRKFLKPIYAELMKTAEGQAMAHEIYAEARAGYHPIAQATIDGIVR
jgi:leukotriene-A4 hydrolase